MLLKWSVPPRARAFVVACLFGMLSTLESRRSATLGVTSTFDNGWTDRIADRRVNTVLKNYVVAGVNGA